MCRSIKPLRMPDRKPTEQEITEVQYVRKVSGYRRPSRVNEETFAGAVTEISRATEKLLGQLKTKQAAL